MGAKNTGNKKNILVGFDLNIQRQNRAYNILSKEKAETGMPYNVIIHEALELYALYHSQLKGTISEDIKGIKSETLNRRGKVSKRPETVQPVEESEAIDVEAEPEEYLTDDDMTDPSYLVGLLNDAYPDED